MGVFDKAAYRIDFVRKGRHGFSIGMTYVNLPYSGLTDTRTELERRGARIMRVLVGDPGVWYREYPTASAASRT